jgi:hypothetical protein
MHRIGRWMWATWISCWLACVPFAVAAQTPPAPPPPGAVIGSPEPSCPYESAMQLECSLQLRVAIGFRENLGAWQGPVEAAVRANPLARVGWPSEFEIARAQYEPQNIVLLDMFNPPLLSAYDAFGYATLPNNYDDESIYFEGTTAGR